MQFLWHTPNKNEVGWVPGSFKIKLKKKCWFCVVLEESNVHNFEDDEA